MDWYDKGFWDWTYSQKGRQVKRAEMSEGGQTGVGDEQACGDEISVGM